MLKRNVPQADPDGLPPYEIFNGGLFVSRGRGRHPERVLESDELIVVLQGELALHEDGVERAAGPGGWIFLRHGHRHGGLAPYPKNLSFFWLHFRFRTGLPEGIPLQGTVRAHSSLAEYARLFLNEQNRVHPDGRILDLLFRLIFRELRLSVGESGDPGVSGPPLYEAARRLIRLRASEHLTTREAAAALKCNADYLGRLWKLRTGETLSVSINRLRIEKAAVMLRENPGSIKETAAACGFEDPAYFRRLFRTFYHMTPGEFRRRQMAVHCNTENGSPAPQSAKRSTPRKRSRISAANP